MVIPLSKSATQHISLLNSPLGARQESDYFTNFFVGEYYNGITLLCSNFPDVALNRLKFNIIGIILIL